MHFLIVWQSDPDVKARFQPLLDKGAGAGVVQAGGHHVRLFEMVASGGPKGQWYDRLPIWSAIMDTANNALQAQGRLAEMSVMFIFHQTSKPAVRSIMGALQLLNPDALDGLARSIPKNLKVAQVVLLSCESAIDRIAPSPVPPVLEKWVNQARDMRNACFEAFTITKVDEPGEFIPVVVTFSTGNAEKGGIILDPWNAKFVNLRGHFVGNDGWDYDRDSNGEADKTRDDSGGTVYGDSPDGSSSTTSVQSGHSIPPLLPPDLLNP